MTLFRTLLSWEEEHALYKAKLLIFQWHIQHCDRLYQRGAVQQTLRSMLITHDGEIFRAGTYCETGMCTLLLSLNVGTAVLFVPSCLRH